MAVRRSRKGVLRSELLTEENSDYCSSVIDLFSKSTGKSRGKLDDELKTLSAEFGKSALRRE